MTENWKKCSLERISDVYKVKKRWGELHFMWAANRRDKTVKLAVFSTIASYNTSVSDSLNPPKKKMYRVDAALDRPTDGGPGSSGYSHIKSYRCTITCKTSEKEDVYFWL